MTRAGAGGARVVWFLVAVVLGGGVLVAVLVSGGDDSGPAGEPAGPLTAREARGRTLYEEHCAVCHGAGLRGTTSGPALLDPIYAPSHHPDEAFRDAVTQGVPEHHWDFGPMPPQPGVSGADIDAIIAYVRARQRDAGIATS